MDTSLLVQGVELMLLGMGIVFGFLTILVFTLRGMSLIDWTIRPRSRLLRQCPSMCPTTGNWLRLLPRLFHVTARPASVDPKTHIQDLDVTYDHE